jgi:SAM-dependent methyltransferase
MDSSMEHGESQKLIAAAYERRAGGRADRLYDLFQAGALYMSQAQERSWLGLLDAIGFSGGRLREKKIYEVGCGGGGMLARLLLWGAAPENLFGCDLLPERRNEAVRRLPASVSLRACDASATGAEAGAYDLVFQSTVLSSISSPEHRRAVAREMWRLASPGGWVVSYDLRYGNPANPDVQPVLLTELAGYFPEASEKFARSVLLVPPLARRLARRGGGGLASGSAIFSAFSRSCAGTWPRLSGKLENHGLKEQGKSYGTLRKS